MTAEPSDSAFAAPTERPRVVLASTFTVDPLVRTLSFLTREKLAKVNLTIYHGLYADETAYLSQWMVPDAHPL